MSPHGIDLPSHCGGNRLTIFRILDGRKISIVNCGNKYFPLKGNETKLLGRSRQARGCAAIEGVDD